MPPSHFGTTHVSRPFKNIEVLLLKNISPEPNTGCWLWTGALDTKGYGVLRRTTAHRISYRVFKGNFPEHWEVHHRCEVKSCVNPDHLDVMSKGIHRRQHNIRKIHCKYGHSLEDAYVYEVYNTTVRHCRTCKRIRRSGQA